MATQNHLTIRDYFDQALFGSTANRKTLSATEADPSDTRSFQRILSSHGNQQFDRSNLKPTGLTVVDYLNNPVRVKCQFNHRLSPTVPEKKETKAVKSQGPAAPLAAKASTDTNFAPSGWQNTHQERTEASASISPKNQTGLNERLIIERSIQRAARRYNLPPGLIKAVIRAESNFQVGAVSQAGAQGLMQLMPETAKELGVENSFDIEQNIDGGARYLRQMLDSFGGDVKVALAA
ncbi:MAG: lytic transglycosylase domain-containing protein, partial [Desulfobacterales bacterium]